LELVMTARFVSNLKGRCIDSDDRLLAGFFLPDDKFEVECECPRGHDQSRYPQR
jgi:hypothetical protein